MSSENLKRQMGGYIKAEKVGPNVENLAGRLSL